MMFEYLAVSLVLTLSSAADYDSCPKVNLFYGIFFIIFAIALFTGACLPNFSKNFVYSGRKTSFLNNFPK